MLTTEQRKKMLEPPTDLVDVVIDTDADNEIDDQFAIAYAIHATNRLKIQAIYAAPYFNDRSKGPKDGMERSYHEIHKLLNLCKKQFPVYKGSEMYLPDEKTYVPSDACTDLAQRAMVYSPEKPLYVIALAAITNIASALLKNPEIADRMVVVWLGGHTLEWPNNQEFNMMQDVAAARIVFDSGVPLVLVPCLNVASAFTTTEPELVHWLSGKNELCDYLVQHTTEVAKYHAKTGVWSRPIWDATAVGWLLNASGELMLDKFISTPIAEYGKGYSQDSRRLPCKYVYFIHRDALFSDLFSKLTGSRC